MAPFGWSLQRSSTMTERIKAILDAVTEKVLSCRPVDKGLAAKKTKRKLARKAKRDD
jgi:hypothetical protein